MNIQLIRAANILFATVMMLAGQWNYLWYIAAMQASLEILNRQPLYLANQYKVYNLIFWIYELVLLERFRTSFLSKQVEWLINCGEHFIFGIIICLKIYIYTAVFSKESPRWKRGMIALIVFNIIGVVNELFQNRLAERSLLVLIPDSIKDIKMNLLGAAIFMMAVACRIMWLKKNIVTVEK